jgi:predicted Zn-dependent peptidase
VDAWTNDHRGPDLLALRILLTERANIGDVERVIDQELQRLSTREPSPAELEKAKNRVSAYHVFGLESNLQRAIRMGSFELFYGDARLLERELDRYLAVSSAQVQAAVKKYLTPSRRSTVRVHPPAGQPAQRAATANLAGAAHPVIRLFGRASGTADGAGCTGRSHGSGSARGHRTT